MEGMGGWTKIMGKNQDWDRLPFGGYRSRDVAQGTAHPPRIGGWAK